MAAAKKEGGLMAIVAEPSKPGMKPMMGGKMPMGEESDEPNEGQKAAADRLAALLGVDADELASALKDFYDNC